MILHASADELWAALQTDEIAAAIQEGAHIQGAMLPYQQAALYRLAQPYDGGKMLEIGCLRGRSARLLACAAPKAEIVTMSPIREHVEAARTNVQPYPVTVLQEYSWDFLRRDARAWNLIFVDGDHRKVARDMPWFNRLEIGGLMVFHDYTRADDIDAHRVYPEICAAVDELGRQLGREPDVRIIDTRGIGMAGFYRQKGERWHEPRR